MFGLSLLALLLILAWIVVLIWLAGRMLGMVAKRTGWRITDWRNWLLCFVLLTVGILLGNYALDWLDYALGTRSGVPALSYPPAFLIASVGIAVPVAGIMAARRG